MSCRQYKQKRSTELEFQTHSIQASPPLLIKPPTHLIKNNDLHTFIAKVEGHYHSLTHSHTLEASTPITLV